MQIDELPAGEQTQNPDLDMNQVVGTHDILMLCFDTLRYDVSKEEEAAFPPFFDQATQGGILIVSEIKRALDERIGRKTATASVYNLLHRHNWRKLTPDKRHPQADVEAQLEWKKNSGNSSR